jgi:hypothetical protein
MNNTEYAMLGEIIRYVESCLTPVRATQGVVVDMIYPKEDRANRSFVTNIQNVKYEARIIFWSSGTGEVSALNCLDPEILFDYGFEFTQIDDVKEHVEKVVELFISQEGHSTSNSLS